MLIRFFLLLKEKLERDRLIKNKWKMDYKTLVNNLKKGEIAPVYFFYGEEKYTIDQVTLRVIDATVKLEVKDFNLDVFYANESDIRKIFDVATSYPMMADRRTVVVKEIQKFTASNLNNLAKYTESPAPTTCLVLVASISNLRGKAYNLLKKNAVSMEFRPLYDNQAHSWIKRYVKEQGKDISEQAIQILQAYVGNSLLNLVNELEKIFLNIENSKRIEVEDVQSVVGFSKEFNIFNLLNAIGQRNLRSALLIVNRLLEHGESPTAMVIRLTDYFSTLLKFLEPQNSRKSDNELAKIAGVNFYFIKDYKAQARNFTIKQMEKAFALLLEADLNLKTSYQTPTIIMELLVYRLIRL